MSETPQRRGPIPGGPPAARMMMAGGPPEKLEDFKGSTKRLLGLLKPLRGTATVDGRDIGQWEPAELAATVGVVPQREETTFPLRVSETVMMGRYAHLGPLSAVRQEDRLAVWRALERCDVGQLSERRVDQLSGGEWQRVRLARALARVINLLDPDAIVLGGGMSNIDALYDELPRRWAPHVFSDVVGTPLRRALHGDSSGVRGAAWLWR